MKKILLGTSALVFAGLLSTAASAETLKMSVAGFANWYVGYANQDSGIDTGSVNPVDVMGDVEVHVRGEAALENGMKVGAVVAFSGGTKAYEPGNDDAVKYSYAYLDTAFGRTLLGLQDAVAKQLYVGGKDVGALGLNESQVFNFLAYDTALIGQATWINSVDRHNMISYVTPNLNGLMLGVSYVPGSDLTSNDNTMLRYGDPTVTLEDNHFRDSVIVAGTYKANLDKGTTLGISAAGASTGLREDDGVLPAVNGRVWEYSLGMQFEKNGLFIGGGYRQAEFEGGSGTDFRIWNASVGYENNKYATSLSYMAGRMDGLDSETLLLSGKYKLTAGVDVFASFAMVSEEVDNAPKVDTMETQVVATGIQLRF